MRGSVWKLGTHRMVKPGRLLVRSLSLARRKSWRAKRLCQASSVITWRGMRYRGSAPAAASSTNTSRPCKYAARLWRTTAKCSWLIGWLFSPHQIFSAYLSWETIYLSFGERPVCAPVVAANAPLAASMPSLRARACSVSSAGDRFQLIFPRLTNPYSSRAFLLIIIVMVFSLLLRAPWRTSAFRLDYASMHRAPCQTLVYQNI